MRKISSWLSTFIFCFLFWELLVWSVNPRELLLGAAVAAAAAWFACPFFIHDDPWFLFQPIRILNMVKYAFLLLWEMIKANVSMAKIVLSRNPDEKMNPGVIRVAADPAIKSSYGLALVSNSITLTPGTITMYVAEDETGQNYYYVQWIDVTETERGKAGEMIKGRIERGAAGIWGVKENPEAK